MSYKFKYTQLVIVADGVLCPTFGGLATLTIF